MPNPNPGWYADPEDAGRSRYWNGEQWTENVLPAPQARRPSSPRRKRSVVSIVFGIIVAIGLLSSGVHWLDRHTSKLDSSRSGTKQQWVDYLDRTKPEVDVLNDSTSSFAEILSALKTLATSPDQAFNTTVERAIRDCAAQVESRCFSELEDARTGYNDALQKAADDDLISIDHSSGS